MERNTRICKKCLLRDTPEEETWQNLYEYMERLPREESPFLSRYSIKMGKRVLTII